LILFKKREKRTEQRQWRLQCARGGGTDNGAKVTGTNDGPEVQALIIVPEVEAQPTMLEVQAPTDDAGGTASSGSTGGNDGA